MTPPRYIVQNRLAFVTCSAVGRSFWFLPTRRVVDLLWYLLAVMSQRTGIEIHEVIFMSNHFHLLLTDRAGVLPDELKLVRPPVRLELTDAELREHIRAEVRRIEDELIVERRTSQRDVVGVQHVLSLSYTDTPTTSRVLFATTPRVSGKSRWARVEALARRLDFERAHAAARVAIAEGLAQRWVSPHREASGVGRLPQLFRSFLPHMPFGQVLHSASYAGAGVDARTRMTFAVAPRPGP